MTTSAVMLLGIAAGRIDGADQSVLSAAGPWSETPPDCAVTQVHLAPTLHYSPEDQGYVVSAIAFDEVPHGCVGLSYHLALVAQDGASIFEVTGVLDEADPGVPIPAADRPRAEDVATTVLSMLPGLPDGGGS